MSEMQKVLELGTEGGTLRISRYFDDKGHDWYVYSVSEMSYDDLDLNGINERSKISSMSFPEAIFRMLKEYENGLSYFPLFIEPEFKPVMKEILTQYKRENEIDTPNWEILLNTSF